MDNGKLTGTVFLDLTKAFDTISHGVLVAKIKSYGVSGCELIWFTDYLFHRSQCAVVKDSTSELMAINNGVPQGSILGPLKLFILFFNDFPDMLRVSKVIQYADDTVIYFSHPWATTIVQTLTEELGRVAEYFDESELIINLRKGKTAMILLYWIKYSDARKKSSISKSRRNYSDISKIVDFGISKKL